MPKGFQHMLGFGTTFQMHIISKFDLFVPQVFFLKFMKMSLDKKFSSKKFWIADYPMVVCM